jgi:hypothetical protein
MSGQNLFSQQIIIFFYKDIIDDDYENECDDFQDVLFNFEQMLRSRFFSNKNETMFGSRYENCPEFGVLGCVIFKLDIL